MIADETLAYGPVDGYSPRMGVYLPAPSDSLAPVVVHVHGGGWAAGDEASDRTLMRQLAARGYLVFTPSYTYAGDGATTWELARRQIARALAEIRAIAPRFGGAADRVYLTGSSAGGQLAPLVANRIAAGDTLGQDAADLPAIAAMSLLIPAVTPAFAEGNRYVPAGAVGRRLVRALISGSNSEFPERYAAADATAYPTIGYILRSRQLGVEVEALAIPWTGHLMGLNGAAGRAGEQLTAEWFARHP